MRKSLVATAALALALAAPPALAAAARKPNVIVILADDLGYGDTSAYGSKIVKTPNIDALAADGVRFTQGYVSHPVCAPSRAALLTGRYQTRFGYEFNPVGRDRTGGVSLGETFVGQVMQKAGYRTGMIGKWHLGEPGGYHPTARGFDEYFGTTAGANAFTLSATLRPGVAPEKGVIGIYKDQLSKKEQRIFMASAGKALAAAGYEADSEPCKLSADEIALFWELDGRIRAATLDAPHGHIVYESYNDWLIDQRELRMDKHGAENVPKPAQFPIGHALEDYLTGLRAMRKWKSYLCIKRQYYSTEVVL